MGSVYSPSTSPYILPFPSGLKSTPPVSSSSSHWRDHSSIRQRSNSDVSLHSTSGDSICFHDRPLSPPQVASRGLTGRLSLMVQNLLDEKQLAKIPNTVDEATRRHEWGHALIADLGNLPFKGVLLTNPDELGSQLNNTRAYPKTREELLKQILMRVSGLAGEKTLPVPTFLTPKMHENVLLSESSHDLDSLMDLLTYGHRKGWLTDKQCAHFPALQIERYIVLAAKRVQEMTDTELREHAQLLGQFRKITTRVPIVRNAIKTADQIQHLIPFDSRQALSQDLSQQSYFSEKDIKKMSKKHIPAPIRQQITTKINAFVSAELRHL
jgi:hypothetical protein